MAKRTFHRWLLLPIVLAVVAAGVGFQPAAAVEPTEKFLEALRDRGYYDLALDYLEQMRTSPLASEEFKRQIPYEQGATLLLQAKRIANTAERSAKIAEAKAKFDAYIEANPTSDRALSVRMELAGALVGHGRAIRVHAENLPPEKKAERIKEMRAAHDAVEQGRSLYEESKKAYRKIFDALPKNINANTDADQYQKRREIGEAWLQAWSLSLLAAFDEALTFPEGSKERKDQLTANAKDLANLKDKYYQHFVGLNAGLFEGRCYFELGKLDDAIAVFEEITLQKAQVPELRRLVSKAIRYQAECYLQQKNFDDVIARCDAWLKAARGDEAKSPDWLAVRYQLATAYLRKMEATEKGSQRRRIRRKAREQFQIIARERSVFWKESRQHHANLVARDGDRAAPEPKTFDEAFDLAKETFEQMIATRAALDAARDNAPDRVPDFEQGIAESQKEAIRLLLIAMPLASERTDQELLNQARGYLCYLYYVDGDFWRSAVLGEYMAHHFPNHPMAKNSAKLAMAAYQRMYADARQAGEPPEALAFEGRQMAEIADLITRRWPGTPDAADALGGLIDFALREKRMGDAVAFLAKVPEGQRATAELKVGGALWAWYTSQMQRDPSARPESVEIEKSKREAIGLLESGFSQASSEAKSPTLAVAGLFLAQAYNREGEYEKAIAIIEREAIGPLALVESNDPSADRAGYATAVYRTALQSYVLVSPPRREEAERLTDALDSAMGGDAESEKKLLQIYIGLGLQLQRQLTSLREKGKLDEAERIAGAFEDFLVRVSDRIADADWKSRLWLARAYYHLGESVDPGGLLPPKAKAYYKKSLAAYDVLLEGKAPDGQPPSAMSLLAARKQQADCFRRLRQYEKAIAGYAELLSQKPMMLDVQQIAAATYQEWGDIDPSKYRNAIAGGHPGPKGENVIYGWVKLARLAARIAARKPKYKALYFEGWLQVAKTRLTAAMAAKGSDKKQQLEKAKRSIRTMFQLYPDLGGDASRRKFEQVLMKIQRALNEKSVGLKEFE